MSLWGGPGVGRRAPPTIASRWPGTPKRAQGEGVLTAATTPAPSQRAFRALRVVLLVQVKTPGRML
jgi:hypothetical protein